MTVIRRNLATALLDRAAPGKRQVWFRLCTQDVDRHGTIIEPAGVRLDAHRDNPVFLWMHESGGGLFGPAPAPDVVIGRVVDYDQAADHLDILVEFDTDELAEACYQKVRRGFLRAVSIGCNVLREERRQVNGVDVPVYAETELIEASLVIVGSNREALTLDRAAALRLVRSLPLTRSPMDKSTLLKALGLGDNPTKKQIRAAKAKYLLSTTDAPDKRTEVARAADEMCRAEEDPDAGDKSDEEERGEEDEDKEDRAAGEEGDEDEGDKDEEKRALTEANTLLRQAVEKGKTEAPVREQKLIADVKKWVKDGHIPPEKEAEFLDKHRKGKAVAIIRHLPRGTFTTGQRLRGGKVGTETEVPIDPPAKPGRAAPETPVKTTARALVQAARGLNTIRSQSTK